ncbi:MAG: hypothetical protein IMW89_18955 [Ktedonobacteraceae bacterium]|nr:hypothetical protein [Ktedonobacteraceae bacterium]
MPASTLRKNYKKTTFLLFFLLFLLGSCGSPQQPVTSRGEKFIMQPTPTPVVKTYAPVPACNQPVCLTDSAVPGGRKLIDTWDGIHTFQVFTYDMSYYTAARLAPAYDFVWGAEVNKVAAFRSGNANILLSYYIPLNRDAGTFYNPGAQRSLSYWQSVHPDWVLYKCDQKTPVLQFNQPYISLDITNPAVIDWQVQNYAVPASQSGYDALALDNLNLDNGFGACGFFHNGVWIQRYTGNRDDPLWRSDMLNYVTALQQKLHALPHPLALIANVGYLNGTSVTDPMAFDIVKQIIAHLDGVTDEAGFTHYGNGFLTGDAWVQTIQLIKETQQQHKPYHIINEFNRTPTHEDINWALASYLMAKDHLSAIFISGNQQYGRDMSHPEYDAQIGVPTTDMYQDQGVYWRKYSKGLAIVNPSANDSFTVNLSGNYVDLYGKAVGKNLSLGAHSGIVLLKK